MLALRIGIMSILSVFLTDTEIPMARFKGPSPAASAHTKMMRTTKAGKGGGAGCAILPFILVGAALPLFARFIA